MDDQDGSARLPKARAYEASHSLKCLHVAANVPSMSAVRGLLRTAAPWFGFGQAKASKAPRDLPAASQLYQHVVRVDIAAMLARRAWYAQRGPTFRYLAFGASPQKGHEFFMTVERVVVREDVDSVCASSFWPVVQAIVASRGLGVWANVSRRQGPCSCPPGVA